MHQITFIVEVVMTLIITIVIGYISKNILQKKLIEQEKQNQEANRNDGHLIGISQRNGKTPCGADFYDNEQN